MQRDWPDWAGDFAAMDALTDSEPVVSFDGDLAEIANAECTHETAKALIVLFHDYGVSRPIPKSQVKYESLVKAPGQRGVLVVTKWLGRKITHDLQDGGMAAKMREATDRTEFTGCICLSETAASVLVLLADGREMRFPRSQIRGGDIEHDGDQGTLAVSRWIAEQKGLLVPTT